MKIEHRHKLDTLDNQWHPTRIAVLAANPRRAFLNHMFKVDGVVYTEYTEEFAKLLEWAVLSGETV